MNSISGSDWLIRAQDLELGFDVRLRAPTSWREIFTQWIGRASRPDASPTRIHALRKVSFEIYPGDRIGILGRNGAGKTSLCRCIAGIYQPVRGTIFRRGRVRSISGGIPLVEPELTGRENARLLYALLYGKLTDQRKSLDDALTFSELGDLLDLPVKFYSTGMTVRLVLSLVSAQPSDVLILDEVFDGADRSFQARIGTRVRDLMRRSGAVLFVSHSLEQVRANCNRVWIYDGGKIGFDGPVEAGIQHYAGRHAETPPALPRQLSFDEVPLQGGATIEHPSLRLFDPAQISPEL